MKSEISRSNKLRFLSVIFGAMIALFLIVNGCGGSMGNNPMMQAGPTTSFAFVANSGSGNISVLAISSSGSLSTVNGSPFSAGAGAEFLAVDPLHRFLFVSNQSAASLSAFSINTSTGMLTPVPGSPFSTGATPHGVAVDPAGKFVFVGNESGSVSAFSINSGNGALTPVPGSPFAATSPFGITVSPSGTFLYVTNTNTGGGLSPSSLSTFKIDGATGSLTAVNSPDTTGATPIGIAADPNGKFLYLAEHMTESVATFSADPSTGALTRMGSTPAAPASCNVSCHLAPLRVSIHPNEQFMFVSNVGGNSVSVFSINNGPMPATATMATGQHPFGTALDPMGNFLLVANKVDNTISSFAVNAATGGLMPVSGSPFSSGGNGPTGIAIVAKQ
ncbi:MAG TPA: beta-propeller fold lactonase family protein [Candidatus Angelobacter sp.]|nr:beta-propeller fold lactonase family protein [Candidatus Angelobacter sp.]